MKSMDGFRDAGQTGEADTREMTDELCPHRALCGGCRYQGVPYAAQLAEKESEVRRLLAQKELSIPRIDPIEGCPSPYGYRNKMEYTFGDLVKDGEMTLGLHRKKSFLSVLTVDHCQLVHPDFNRLLRAVLDFAREEGLSFYHKKSHRGLLRNLVLRRGVRTGEILVNLVTTSEEGLDERDFAEKLRALPLENKLVGVLRTIDDDPADAVVCEELRVLWGRDSYEEELLGLRFRVSAFSFFQTNVEAVERLYSEAVALLPSISEKTVFDLYCGTGTISQIMARQAASVLGIELVEEAVEVARQNAARNGLTNCRFLAGDVFRVLETVSEKPDIIVVDPPRTGIQPKALDRIIAYGAPYILYISCNPKTLVENLKYLEHYGYRCEYLKPFDNFPMTGHTEAVVLCQG